MRSQHADEHGSRLPSCACICLSEHVGLSEWAGSQGSAGSGGHGGFWEEDGAGRARKPGQQQGGRHLDLGSRE